MQVLNLINQKRILDEYFIQMRQKYVSKYNNSCIRKILMSRDLIVQEILKPETYLFKKYKQELIALGIDKNDSLFDTLDILISETYASFIQKQLKLDSKFIKKLKILSIISRFFGNQTYQLSHLQTQLVSSRQECLNLLMDASIYKLINVKIDQAQDMIKIVKCKIREREATQEIDKYLRGKFTQMYLYLYKDNKKMKLYNFRQMVLSGKQQKIKESELMKQKRKENNIIFIINLPDIDDSIIQVFNLIHQFCNSKTINFSQQFLLKMNMIFASERERQMMLLRKNKLKQVLDYNLQEIERKRTIQEHQKHQFENAYQTMASQALQNLHEENRKKSIRRESQKNMLKDSYEKQIRDKEQRARIQKMKDREYFDRQRAYSEYEEARRMVDLRKMFDRITYQGVLTPAHKKTKTETNEKEIPYYNPEPPTFHLPNINPKSIKTQGNDAQSPNHRYQQKFNSLHSLNKNTLDNINVESFQKPSRATPQKLN